VALEVWPSLAVEKIEDLRGPALASRSTTVLASSRIKEASTFRFQSQTGELALLVARRLRIVRQAVTQ